VKVGVGHLRQAWQTLTAPGLAVEDVPLLARGRHEDPRDGASLLELVAVYAQEPWSIRPPSVNRALATAAQAVNDHTSDQGRRRLIPLVPLITGTGGQDLKVSYAVSTVCLTEALHLVDAGLGRQFHSIQDDLRVCTGAVDSPKRAGARRSAQSRRTDVAISRAVAAVAAAEPEPARRDASLRVLLVAATTAARRARGLSDATPSISHIEPDHIRVVKRSIAEPGCDWLSLVCLPAGEAERARVFGVSPVSDLPA
jgi:hypothetical protein